MAPGPQPKPAVSLRVSEKRINAQSGLGQRIFCLNRTTILFGDLHLDAVSINVMLSRDRVGASGYI
jgi:hypothetical protein